MSQVLVVLLLTGLAVLNWSMLKARNGLLAEIHFLASNALYPFVGCSVIGACTGWTAYAHCGRYRIARTLVLIAVGSVMIWFPISVLSPQPARAAPAARPLIDVQLLVFLIVPPILTASILTVVRARRAIKLSTPEEEW